MKKTILLITTIMAVTVADSLAQQAPPEGGRQGGRGGRGGGGEVMGALDLNSDGTLDAREIQSAPMSLRKLDANKDFKLTPDELGTRGGGDMTQRMLSMDANKDGKLTSDEVPERMQRFIERLDTDGDGAVDKAEMEAMQQRFREGGGRGGRGGEGGDRGQQD